MSDGSSDYRTTALGVLRSGGLTYFGYGIVAFLFVVLWRSEGLGPVSIVLVFAPLLLAQWSIQQMFAEQTAHFRTVESLVAAVEARHPSTRGVSQATAQVASAIGDELKLRPRQAESLWFAAMLHNVGLIAPMSREVVVTQDKLSGDYISQILRHPDRSVEILERIRFLEGSVKAIRHHHERWDGRGYPDGLAREEIPLLARIISVSDAFVSVVRGSTGLPPERAVAVLEERSETQLCPHCLRALRKAVLRDRVQASVVDLGDVSGPDHDNPALSDMMVMARERKISRANV